MDVSCFFCGGAAEFESTADALEAGWFTHWLTSSTLSADWDEPVVERLNSVGFACPPCVAIIAGAQERAVG